MGMRVCACPCVCVCMCMCVCVCAWCVPTPSLQIHRVKRGKDQGGDRPLSRLARSWYPTLRSVLSRLPLLGDLSAVEVAPGGQASGWGREGPAPALGLALPRGTSG